MKLWGKLFAKGPPGKGKVDMMPLSTIGRPAWIFLGASLCSIIWGIVILAYGPQNNVPLHGLLKAFSNQWLLGVVLLAAGVMGLVARWKKLPPTKVVALISLQQLMALLAIVSVLLSVVSGKYPDGTERSWMFILTDQLPLLLGGVLHTMAVVDYCTGVFSIRLSAPDYLSDYRTFEELMPVAGTGKLTVTHDGAIEGRVHLEGQVDLSNFDKK
jgi:hypothetical protein